jgi:hypothetical protein
LSREHGCVFTPLTPLVLPKSLCAARGPGKWSARIEKVKSEHSKSLRDVNNVCATLNTNTRAPPLASPAQFRRNAHTFAAGTRLFFTNTQMRFRLHPERRLLTPLPEGTAWSPKQTEGRRENDEGREAASSRSRHQWTEPPCSPWATRRAGQPWEASCGRQTRRVARRLW